MCNCLLPLALAVLHVIVTGAADDSMRYLSLKCRSGFRLHSSGTADETLLGVSKMRCLQHCYDNARRETYMRIQCKSISYSAAEGGRCVLSPLRLFSTQNVDNMQGWTVCTQRLVLFIYMLNGAQNAIAHSEIQGVCEGLGDARLATRDQVKHGYDHGWRFCSHGRVTNGHILMLKDPKCKSGAPDGFNEWPDFGTLSNVFCIGSEADIRHVENQQSFAYEYGHSP